MTVMQIDTCVKIALQFFLPDKEAKGMSGTLYEQFPESIAAMKENPSRWRRTAAEQLAAHLDMETLGVTGIYLFGSTDTENASESSDIDLIIRVNAHDPSKDALLRAWLDEWDLLLCRLNFVATGKTLPNILDTHIVSEEDIKQQSCFGSKIGSVYDPATPLRVKCLNPAAH